MLFLRGLVFFLARLMIYAPVTLMGGVTDFKVRLYTHRPMQVIKAGHINLKTSVPTATYDASKADTW